MKTCEKCEELKLHIAWLEGELGLQHSDTETNLVTTAFRLSRMEAWFAITLWKCNGRTVSPGWLLDAKPAYRKALSETPSYNMLRVYMHKVRGGLGHDSIGSTRGHGYFMTTQGMNKMNNVLRKVPDDNQG